MNAPLTKEQLAVLAPNTLTRPAMPVQGLVQRVVDGVRWLAELPRRQATVDELSRLSDRELADIGLTRFQVRHLYSRA